MDDWTTLDLKTGTHYRQLVIINLIPLLIIYQTSNDRVILLKLFVLLPHLIIILKARAALHAPSRPHLLLDFSNAWHEA